MGEERDDKIRKAFIRETMPLLDVWSAACELDDIEKEILRLKYFDETNPTEDQILAILQDKFNYYYSDRHFRKHWRKIRRNSTRCQHGR